MSYITRIVVTVVRVVTVVTIVTEMTIVTVMTVATVTKNIVTKHNYTQKFHNKRNRDKRKVVRKTLGQK